MSISSRLAGVLLLTSALCSPSLAFAQSDPAPSEGAPPVQDEAEQPGADAPDEAPPPQEEQVDISIPGGSDIVVTGNRDRNIAKASDQVVSVLSAAEIARTGEGNIAGALGRVTGLSVVGSGYVYVRGLGDRYSLALLNGLPLPSPEPLRRVVPLDLFPSGVIASSLVQKSYSANFPGEFGGGVINLTTKAIPTDPFLTIGAGVSGDTETTGHTGYTYYGSKTDFFGFDNGARDITPNLQAFLASGEKLSSGNVDSGPIAAELVNFRNGVLQRYSNVPANFSTTFSAGKAFDLGGVKLGVIANAGYSNKFQNREAIQQTSLAADLSTLNSDFRQVNTDQRIVVNGLLGFGLEFDDNKIRWTNLIIRDTIKQARLSLGRIEEGTADVMRQRSAWYERQLIDTQVVGEFSLGSDLKLDLRGSYANSQRQAPFELSFEYVRTNSANDLLGQYYINLFNRTRGDARVVFSDLNEDLWAGGADLTYLLTPEISVTVGGAYTDTHRVSSRRGFVFDANIPANLQGVGTLRPDLLLQPEVVDLLNISLFEEEEGVVAFDATLRNWAGYAKVNAQITDTLSLDAGVRYEKAEQGVTAIEVFNEPSASTPATSIENQYWLPAATITWQIRPDLQVRLSGSKTIARPQFRELINQPYFDPESNRSYRGNPLLIDGQLYNGEARVEWYFARDQRLTAAGFYKLIKNPIESFLTGGDLLTSFANAPEAVLYGAEVEAQKHFDLSGWGDEDSWFADRRFVVIGNYTFTKSELKVSADDETQVFGAFSTRATDYFRNGAPLTGQSDHLVNLQLGLENTEKLSQQTFLLTYASERVVSRGLNGVTPQPDVVERPGFSLDFVAREGFDLGGRELEVKFEARNITGRRHVEFQQSGAKRIDTNSYDLGRSFALSASLKF